MDNLLYFGMVKFCMMVYLLIHTGYVYTYNVEIFNHLYCCVFIINQILNIMIKISIVYIILFNNMCISNKKKGKIFISAVKWLCKLLSEIEIRYEEKEQVIWHCYYNHSNICFVYENVIVYVFNIICSLAIESIHILIQ